MPRFTLDATTLRKQLEPLVNNWHRQTVSMPASKETKPSQSFGRLDVTDVILGQPTWSESIEALVQRTNDPHELLFKHTLTATLSFCGAVRRRRACKTSRALS